MMMELHCIFLPNKLPMQDIPIGLPPALLERTVHSFSLVNEVTELYQELYLPKFSGVVYTKNMSRCFYGVQRQHDYFCKKIDCILI